MPRIVGILGALALGMAGLGHAGSSPAMAQGQVAGAEAVPPHIPTAAFASQAALGGAQLSPDGSKFAFSFTRDGSTYLLVHDADTREMVQGVNLGELEFNWFQWAGSDHLLFSMSFTDEVRFNRLYTMRVANAQIEPLALRKMEYDADDVVFVDPDGRYVLASIANEIRDAPPVWRFDLGGEGPPEPVMVQSGHADVASWIADDTGVVRIGLGIVWTGNVKLRYRSSATDDWREVARTRLDDDDLKFWDFIGLRAGSDLGYSIAVPEGGDRRVLLEFDFSTGETGRIAHQQDGADVYGVTFSEAGEPIGIRHSEGFEWLQEDIRGFRSALAGALAGRWVSIQDRARDGSRMIVREYGPADPGALYIFTPDAGRLDLFAEVRPQVPVAFLPEPELIDYTARDGTEIEAYLTLPKGREARGLPLIVHPHGGPYGIRSVNQYDDTVQLLANRGYAVIEPNFRGSGGYGTAFEELGNGEIGRKMQDDLDDAVAHLVAEGIVDPQRVCIVGGSYGGFAALWGAIRNPEIYRCAASWAGVTHFERQLAHDKDYLFGRNRRSWSQQVAGDKTAFDLDDVSPAVQVARLTRPVLLAHGEKDNTVPFDQFELMVSRAKGAGVSLETLALEESGHGFSGSDDEQAWYDALTDFLERHNPAG